MTTGTLLGQWRPMLEASRDRTLKTSTHGAIVLTHATGARMVAVWTLAPAPKDPVLHLEAAHATARQHLGRLTGHDPAYEVSSVMTNEPVLQADRRPSGAAHVSARRATLHVHPAQGAPPRARPRARSPEPDRPVAHLAPRRRRADTDRWLGPVDRDPARRSVTARSARSRRMALANRSGRAAPPSAGRGTHSGRARLATARRRLASTSCAPPRGPLRAALLRVARRGAAFGRCRATIRRGVSPFRRGDPSRFQPRRGRIGRLSGSLRRPPHTRGGRRRRVDH